MYNRTRMVRLLLLGVLLITSSVAVARIWTDTTGRKVEADFVRLEGGKIYLKTASGKVVAVPLERMSEADQEFAKAAAKPTSPDAAASPDDATPPDDAADPDTSTPAAAPSGNGTGEPAPPSGQTYIGVKRCAPCHFESYMSWTKDRHAKTFDILTEKYQKDAKCLECHTTGYGEPTGFKDMETTPHLANNQCENCHGPGSKHEEVAKPFAKIKKLTPEQEKTVRDSIWRLSPGLVCIKCHTQKAHGKNNTPPEMQTK